MFSGLSVDHPSCVHIKLKGASYFAEIYIVDTDFSWVVEKIFQLQSFATEVWQFVEYKKNCSKNVFNWTKHSEGEIRLPSYSMQTYRYIVLLTLYRAYSIIFQLQ